MCPMERYIVVAQNWPKPPCLRSLFLRAGYKRAVLGTKILSNGKGHFSLTNRNNWTGQSGPNILVGPNQNGLFHLMYQAKFLKFFVEWKAPQNSLEAFFYQPFQFIITLYSKESWLNRYTEIGNCPLVDSVLAWKNSWHFMTPPLVKSQQNDVCGTTAEI